MTQKWLAAAAVLAALISGPAKADVTYIFFDSSSPSTVDLGFTVADQLSPTNPTEPFLSTSGVFAADFAGGAASYFQGPPSLEPAIDAAEGNFASEELFPTLVVVPGNGSYPVSGVIYTTSGALAYQSAAAISGVPEPGSWALLITGLAGLAFLRSRRAGGMDAPRP